MLGCLWASAAEQCQLVARAFVIRPTTSAGSRSIRTVDPVPALRTAPDTPGRSVRRAGTRGHPVARSRPALRLLAPNYPAWQEATSGPLNVGAGSTSNTVSHVGPPGGDGLRLFDERGDQVVARGSTGGLR